MHRVLSLIIEAKKRRLDLIKNNMRGFISLIQKAPRTSSLKSALKKDDGISIIGEIKQATQ